MKNLTFILTLICCYQQGFGQADLMEDAWNQSQDQWLCRQIELSEPLLFKNECPRAIILRGGDDMDDAAAHHGALLDFLYSDCSRLRKMKSLSDLYFPLFETKIESLGMSDDLKFIPLVLSGLNSSHVGAKDRSGLWQLDFLTARKFGVDIDDQVDFRNAPDYSTDVALAYLQLLESKYPNDLDRVLLAYYKSIAYVEKLPVDFKLADLDAEAKAFVHYMRWLPELWMELEIDNTVFAHIEVLNGYENVVFDKEVSFFALSKVLQQKESDLRQSNPVFIGATIPGEFRDQPFILSKASHEQYKLLKDSIFSFEEREKARLQALAEKQKKELASNIPAGATEHTYKVRSGDVLGTIAQKFGVRVSDIRNWNDLSGDRINVGQNLVVYRKKNSPTPKVEKEPEPKPQPTPSTSGSFINYEVKPGESLWLIAKRFPGVSADNIMKWNDIDEDIQPGQVLKIYQ